MLVVFDSFHGTTLNTRQETGRKKERDFKKQTNTYIQFIYSASIKPVSCYLYMLQYLPQCPAQIKNLKK